LCQLSRKLKHAAKQTRRTTIWTSTAAVLELTDRLRDLPEPFLKAGTMSSGDAEPSTEPLTNAFLDDNDDDHRPSAAAS
jgi:hypothetical protein